MKAKKILSLLLTVAMIVACSVSAFAAPTGYDSYVQTGSTLIMSEGQPLYEGAVMPVLDGDNAVRADITVAPLTDAEVSELYGATPQDMGCPAEWKDATYLVNVDAKNLGTLVAKRTGAMAALYKYNGFKVNRFAMSFKFDTSEVVCVGALSSATSDDITSSVFVNGFASENEYKFEYQDSTPKGGYPADNAGTFANASVDGMATLMFFAKPGAEIEIIKCAMSYNNYNNSEAKDADGSPWSNTTVAYWHPASITLGEAEEETKTVGFSTVLDYVAGKTGVRFAVTTDDAAVTTKTKTFDVPFNTTVESKVTGCTIGLNVNEVPADVTLTATAELY